MRIRSVEALAVRLPRDLDAATGTAGSPIALGKGSRLVWADSYRTIYSTSIETMLVRVETAEGVVGWGEAQAPVAPEVSKAIVDVLLAPILIGTSAEVPAESWDLMYSAMRVRGQTGGFMLDAISAVDIALWDIAGKVQGQPVSRLLDASAKMSVPTYISGLQGKTRDEKLAYAGMWHDRGAKAFKVFHHATERECVETVRDLRRSLGDGIEIYVDALWRLDVEHAIRFSREIEKYRVGFLEAPLAPEDVEGHSKVAAKSAVPIAVGESYRTRYEVMPFLKARACKYLQPDIGRCGITEGQRIAALARDHGVAVAPHLSIGFGPQIAAALHFSAAVPGVSFLECNPQIYDRANAFLRQPIAFRAGIADVPEGPGLGIEMIESKLRAVVD
jgi:D-galactarolactone cycloisomerase